MQSLSRTVMCASALAVLVPAGFLAAQVRDPMMGAWTLDVNKSKYDPGPLPRSLIIKFESAGQGVRVMTKGVDADGNPTATEYTANLDGKDYPATGSPNYDAVSLTLVDARTVKSIAKKNGKVVISQTRILAKDGKSYTARNIGVNAKGQQFDNVAVFEKQSAG